MSAPPKKRKRGTATGRTNVESRQELMREQLRLSQTEAEIGALLTLINEQINVLEVEELQMRANSFSTDIKFIPTYKEEAPLSEPNLPKSHDEINKQDLDLDLIVTNIFNTIEEEEDSE